MNIDNKTIKGYELVDELGAGGFGVVYRAHQALLKRDVAIKFILPIHANKPDFVRRFETEAELIARLEHPHIVPIYDYWRDPDGAYIVMRYIQGANLRQKLTDDPLSEDQSVRIVEQIASALHFAHRHLVVHRDLKPENILIDNDGNAYLLDFGIAKDLAVAQDPNNDIGGTLMYAAPEQLTGDPITAKVDLYSLGLLVYEMLTGNLPHKRTTPHAIKQLQMDQDLPEDSTIPKPIMEILRQATHSDPDQRFDSAMDFAEALRRSVNSAQLSTTTTTMVSVPTPTVPTIDDQYVELTNPYKGLMAFQEYDSHNFFGRDSLTDQIIEKLNPKKTLGRFLAVIGPSGSGKSSVVKAGLLPRIRDGAIPGSENWFVVEMYPGSRPFDELEVALLSTSVKTVPSLKRDLINGANGLNRALDIILPDDNTQLLLVIDQFEELFTLVEDETQRSLFINSLLNAITYKKSRLLVIVTLRADFYDKPLQYHNFGQLLRRRTEVVLPLSSSELEAAIRQPAENVGAQFESGLVHAIVNDVSTQPGMLPLLQYTLTQLFEKRTGRTLTLETFEQLGGVTGALARHADNIYEQLSSSQKDSTRQLFLRLVTLGEGTEDTRRRVQQTELESIPEINAILDHFGEARLLTFDRDPITRLPTAEVAHEALIRSWDRFKTWVDDNRDQLRIQRNLTTATNEWLANNMDKGFLASDTRLEQFSAWAKQDTMTLSSDEQLFLKHSVLLQKQRAQAEIKRKAYEAKIAQRALNYQRITVGLIIVVIITGIAIVGAIVQSRDAQSQLGTAVFAQDQALIAQNTLEIREQNANTQVAVAARTLTPIPRTLEAVVTRQANAENTRTALLGDAYSYQMIGLALQNFDTQENALAFAFEAVKFDNVPFDVERIFVDIANKSYTEQFAVDLNSTHIAFSPDGRLLAATRCVSASQACSEYEIRLWDINNERALHALSGEVQSDANFVFSSDGKSIAAISNGDIILWDTATGEQLNSTIIENSFNDEHITFTANNQQVLIVDRSAIIMWDITSDTVPRVHSLNQTYPHNVISTDGQTIIRANDTNGIELWETTDNSAQVRDTLFGHKRTIRDLVLHKDNQLLVSADSEGLIGLWDVSSGIEVDNFYGPTDSIYSLAISPDAKTFAIGGFQKITLRNIDNRADILELNAHSGRVQALLFSPNGEMLASKSGNSIKVWDLSAGREVYTFSAPAEKLIFSPDGRFLATNNGKLWKIMNLAQIRAWIQTNIDIRKFTCDERENYNMAIQCNADGQVLLDLPYPTPTFIPVPSWTPFWKPDPNTISWETINATATQDDMDYQRNQCSNDTDKHTRAIIYSLIAFNVLRQDIEQLRDIELCGYISFRSLQIWRIMIIKSQNTANCLMCL